MRQIIDDYVMRCDPCQRRKDGREYRAPLGEVEEPSEPHDYHFLHCYLVGYHKLYRKILFQQTPFMNVFMHQKTGVTRWLQFEPRGSIHASHTTAATDRVQLLRLHTQNPSSCMEAKVWSDVSKFRRASNRRLKQCSG
jgi:hypothetical protein